MDKFNKIARKLINANGITIRKLLSMNKKLQIIDEYNSFLIDFNGPVKLTADAISRWNQILDKEVIINNNSVIVIDINDSQELKQICALFNTINGNVNENTYNKYILK